MSVDLAIDRLSATLHPAGHDGGGASQRRLDRVLHRAVGTSLPAAVTGLDLPPGRWFVPRLDLSLLMEDGIPDGALAQRWTDALVRALAGGIRHVPGAVRYEDDVALLTDALTGLATGRIERLWVWRQAGLLAPGEAVSGASTSATVVAMLHRSPEHAVAALRSAATSIGVPRLDRVLGRGWDRLPALLPGGAAAVDAATAALQRAPSGTFTAPRRSVPEAVLPDAPAAVHGAGGPPRDRRTGAETAPEPPAALVRELLSASPLAAAFRRAGLRPELRVVAAWAVLVVADADPASLRRGNGPQLVTAVARQLLAGVGAPPLRWSALPDPVDGGGQNASPPSAFAGPRSTSPPGEAPARSPAASPEVRPSRSAPSAEVRPSRSAPSAGGRQDADPPPHADPPRDAGSPDTWLFTPWAGLPFLLTTAALAGLPDRVVEHPAFADRPLRWVVHRVGQELVDAEPADAAVLALAGVDAGSAGWLLDAAPPTSDEQRAVGELARDWAAVTAARYLSTGQEDAEVALDPRQVVGRIAGRPGWVSGRPGWIDVQLPLAEVDIGVRRAGLDLDPGWVPWLGTVVRYLYD